MHLPLQHAWASSPERLAIALAVTVAFAVLARAVRGVNRSGMLAGGAACFLLYAGAGPAAFATLTALFVLTWASTRLGYRRKLELGLAEKRDGRSAWQVLANLAVASLSAAAFGLTGRHLWLVVVTAALAEGATDTVASEIGESCSRTAFLITTWKQVPAGTDGGITLAGTAAGAGAGLVIAATAATARLIRPGELWIPTIAAIAGMLFDSALGATLQRRKWLSNEAVNLLGTLVAAAVAWYSP